MSTTVEKDIVVDVPVRTVYDQWAQFEEFPRFMGGVQQVTQLADDRLEWVAEIGGVRRQWVARILEQTPDRKVAWAATEGATNAGAVTFQDLGDGRTSVRLELEYEPEGFVEQVGDTLNVVENQAEKDLERFKEFIESEGRAPGSWRGSVGEGTTVGTPGVEDAAASRADRRLRRRRGADDRRPHRRDGPQRGHHPAEGRLRRPHGGLHGGGRRRPRAAGPGPRRPRSLTLLPRRRGMAPPSMAWVRGEARRPGHSVPVGGPRPTMAP
ncbi:SRPBCC family protein [Micrococcus flavus]|uniref:Uncharacterized protein YndB with AHSA1/START domain n=1 Tax=Micrococcus flavus TaxID=384602 RepID=A0A4Y8WUM9_9MICC|nr:SRPBCC family protein [Micrococcus flavus]MBB4883503.1 uncharacterized protein YndB with AHSA1/START domain [Micrococcus flavus]TFH98580.1 SRPBCC family protein [Micrococcus flavus]GGK53779.1 hypothetical protein GCM10007073_20990 [Micrococcus flavus]